QCRCAPTMPALHRRNADARMARIAILFRRFSADHSCECDREVKASSETDLSDEKPRSQRRMDTHTNLTFPCRLKYAQSHPELRLTRLQCEAKRPRKAALRRGFHVSRTCLRPGRKKGTGEVQGSIACSPPFLAKDFS